MKRGLFIAFEGVESVGKSTQATLLANRIRSELDREVVLTREPGGTVLAEKLRSLVLERNGELIDDRTEALVMAAARAHHVSQLILPSLRAEKYVVCDRFAGSFLAYQGFGRDLDLDILETITHFASAAIEPDLTFFLDLDLREANKRKEGESDRIETESDEFFAKVANGFSILAEKESWVTVDASLSPNEIHEQLFTEVVLLSQTFGER